MKCKTFNKVWKESDIDKALGVSISGWITGNEKMCKKIVRYYWDFQQEVIDTQDKQIKELFARIKEVEQFNSDLTEIIDDCDGDCFYVEECEL